MLVLTPTHCAAVYDMLRALPPFDKAGLPESDEIEFKTANRPDICGEFVQYDPHIITISTANVGYLGTLVEVMAHEMVHLWQTIDKTSTNSQHNADWHKKARKVSRSLGFDPKAF